MAQAFDVADIFEKDAAHLAQEIELKRNIEVFPKLLIPPKPVYDARLMTKPPSKRSSAEEIVELLAPHIQLGLKLEFDENAERWLMRCGKKSDEGTMRMPLRTILSCAENLMR